MAEDSRALGHTARMSHLLGDAFVYHLYPLGVLGAPARNDFAAAPVQRLDGLLPWLDSAAQLGATALYVGPVFESTAHGYDTADYYHVDRRLGDDAAFAAFSEQVHRHGMKLLLDGVFHHVGRDFWAFRDVLASPEASRYRDWFYLDPNRPSLYGDPFSYQGWRGHFDLVKLNVQHPDVKRHLFDAVRSWVERFQIDGLRLDAADVLDREFQSELAQVSRGLRADFWLIGEVIHGDYRRWVGPGRLDSVTNYELYKGLYSSHNDANYFEVAHSLARQFGPNGMYAGMPLYTFADNHDVDRIASRLKESNDIYPLHILLFTVPGVPSIYYGSEWGVLGRKTSGSDAPLRPALTPSAAASSGAKPDLRASVLRLAALRQTLPALRRGAYHELAVASQQFAFERFTDDQRIVIAVNSSAQSCELRLKLPGSTPGQLLDLLDAERSFAVRDGQVVLPLPAQSGRILRHV